MKTQQSSAEKYIPLLLFLATFLFGFFLLNKALFHYDAIVLAQAIEKSYATKTIQPSMNGRYSDVILSGIIYFPFWLAGHTADFAVRLTGILFHAAGATIFYLFIRTLFNNTFIGITAALLYATHPIILSPNTYGKIQSIALFFLLLTLWLLLTPTKKRLWTAAATAFASVMGREAMLLFYPLIILFAFYTTHKNHTKNLLHFIIPFTLITLIVLFTPAFDVLTQTLDAQHAHTSFFLYSKNHLTRALNHLNATSGTLPTLFALLTLFFSTITLCFLPLFFTIWFALSFFFFANMSTYEARYLDVVLIPLLASTARIVGIAANRQRIIGIILLTILLITPLTYSIRLMHPRTTSNGPAAFGTLIATKTEPHAVIITQNEAPIVSYYGKRHTLGLPVGNTTQSIAFWNEIKNNITQGTPIWLTLSALFDDPGDTNRNIIAHEFDFTQEYKIISEDYHHTDIRQLQYIAYLWKLHPKTNHAPTPIPKPAILKNNFGPQT